MFRRKIFLSILAILALSVLFTGALFYAPGLLKAEELISMLLGFPVKDFPVISEEELAKKELWDTGWECGNPDRHFTYILINDSPGLLCVPTEVRDDCLMIPLEHFCLIAGGGLETGKDGKPRLIKYDKAYLLEAGSPLLVCEDESWTFTVAPYEAHGVLYVPLRFLCEALDMEIRWYDGSGVLFIHSVWVDAAALISPLTGLNQTLLASIKSEEWPYNMELVEITVTFYFSKRNPPYTASGAIAAPGSIAADVSIPYGTQYYIPALDMIREDCIFTVHDRGRAVKGDLIDVFVPNSFRDDPPVNAILRKGKFKTTAYIIPSDD